MFIHELPYQEFIFRQYLPPYKVNFLRSVVLQLTQNDDVLYHNHLKNGFRYQYPLIQYKSILGQAGILYLGEAVKSIGKLFNQNQKLVTIDNDVFDLHVDKMHAQIYRLQLSDKLRSYDLINWLPLQDKNFTQYQSLIDPVEKETFLVRLLTANILAFAKGVGWHIDDKVLIENFKIYKEKWISFKDQKFLGFNIRFNTNVFLPPHIGLGKGAAHNYGVLFPVKKSSKIEQINHE